MKIPKVRYVFDRKGVADNYKSKTASTKGLLQIEVYLDGKRKWYSTGIKLFAGQWKDAVVNHQDSIEMNMQLASIMKSINQEIASQSEKNDYFMFSGLDAIFASRDKGDNLVDYVNSLVDEFKINGKSYSTFMMYAAMAGHLSGWNRKIGVSEVDLQSVRSFDKYMERIGLTQQTRWLYHCKLKHTCRLLVKEHRLMSNPYDEFETRKPKDERPKYLTREELDKVRDVELTKDNERFCRDVFMFQSYTGMSISDVFSLRLDDVRMIDGKWILNDSRKKTGVDFVICILPKAMDILQRHGSLDKYSLQHVNDVLHDVGYKAIGRKITTHMARHSFATQALSLGVDIVYVSKILGHTNVTTTQRYAKALADDVIKQFDKLDAL